MKVIQETIKYLKHIDKLSERLSPKQKKELSNIISALLTLLVSLKRDSNLGNVDISSFLPDYFGRDN